MADFFLGESLVGDGNEVAHIDLIIGSKTGPAGAAFCNALTNNKDGFTTLLAVVAPNLPAKPDTLLFNKVTIKGAAQAVQMFGPAQAAVARAVVDSVESGVIPRDKADDYCILVVLGVPVDEDADQDAVVVDAITRDDAALDRVDHGARDRRLRRPEHLHRLRGALDRDLVEEKSVRLCRQVRRHDREQGAEAVLLVREGMGEGRAGRSRLRSDDQVDVCHFVAFTNQ